MKLQVTFKTKTGHEAVEIIDSFEGSTCDYKLRVLALGWVVVSVVPVEQLEKGE